MSLTKSRWYQPDNGWQFRVAERVVLIFIPACKATGKVVIVRVLQGRMLVHVARLKLGDDERSRELA